MANHAFDKTVGARTNVARQVLEQPELLAAYRKVGGREDELRGVVEAGLEAEACDRNQVVARAAAAQTTARKRQTFTQLRQRHRDLMALLRVVQRDLTVEQAGPESLNVLRGVLEDDTSVRYVAVPPMEGAPARREARRRTGMVSVVEEIRPGLIALLGSPEVLTGLAKRGVDRAALEGLLAEVDAFYERTAEGISKGAAGKSNTLGEYEAVRRQRELWSVCYALLRLAAKENPQLASMLKATARR